MLLSVTLMSPPALLHAIPVERFPVIETAARLKVWFLVTAAAWRFALLRSVTELPCLVVAIVPCFAACNLEHVPFDVMTGLQKGECGRNDCADMLRLRNYDASRRFEPPPRPYDGHLGQFLRELCADIINSAAAHCRSIFYTPLTSTRDF